MGRPSTSAAMVWDRSPCATAVTTRVISVVGQARSSTSSFTFSIRVAQRPVDVPSGTRCLRFPSRLTA